MQLSRGKIIAVFCALLVCVQAMPLERSAEGQSDLSVQEQEVLAAIEETLGKENMAKLVRRKQQTTIDWNSIATTLNQLGQDGSDLLFPGGTRTSDTQSSLKGTLSKLGQLAQQGSLGVQNMQNLGGVANALGFEPNKGAALQPVQNGRGGFVSQGGHEWSGATAAPPAPSYKGNAQTQLGRRRSVKDGVLMTFVRRQLNGLSNLLGGGGSGQSQGQSGSQSGGQSGNALGGLGLGSGKNPLIQGEAQAMKLGNTVDDRFQKILGSGATALNGLNINQNLLSFLAAAPSLVNVPTITPSGISQSQFQNIVPTTADIYETAQATTTPSAQYATGAQYAKAPEATPNAGVPKAPSAWASAATPTAVEAAASKPAQKLAASVAPAGGKSTGTDADTQSAYDKSFFDVSSKKRGSFAAVDDKGNRVISNAGNHVQTNIGNHLNNGHNSGQVHIAQSNQDIHIDDSGKPSTVKTSFETSYSYGKKPAASSANVAAPKVNFKVQPAAKVAKPKTENSTTKADGKAEPERVAKPKSEAVPVPSFTFPSSFPFASSGSKPATSDFAIGSDGSITLGSMRIDKDGNISW